MKNQLHDAHMDEIMEDDIQELSWDQFSETIASLREKKSSKYEFILKGGPSVIEAVFHLCKAVWHSAFRLFEHFEWFLFVCCEW